jgi:nicotinate-nucleotide--dimethylbenzimidazole phosphoribosyltransferase
MQTPDSIKEIISGIVPLDEAWRIKARQRSEELLMPTRALGRLLDMAERCCAIGRTLTPVVDAKGIIVMAGDHGVAGEGVSAYPQEVSGAMVQTFLMGGAGINAMAGQVDARVWVVDMGIIPDIQARPAGRGPQLVVKKIARGTASLTKGPAMSAAQAEQAVMAGFDQAGAAFADGVQILGTGDMGIGNTTPSAAIGAAITGAGLDDMVGRGTGVDDAGLARKKEVVARCLSLNRPDAGNGLDVLAKVGGFEIGGIAGLVLGAAYHRKPVVIDGFISTAGALIAYALCPAVADYIFAGHQSREPGHRIMLEHMGLTPILNLDMRLGEGTGAALAMGIIQGAVRAYKEMMTFEEANVPNKD